MTKTAIVTAAGKGIGAGIARKLAADGYDVGVLGRSADVEALAAEIGGFAFRGDVTVQADIEAFVELARARNGRIDAAVVSTGHAPKKPALELSDADWHGSLDIVLLPFVRVARAVAADLKASKGALVAISSYVARRPDPTFVVSSSLRAALENYAKILARDFAPDGVSVNIVAPGFADSLPVVAERLARIPAGRYGRVDEIASAVSYLVDPQARYVTGQTIILDGGLTS